MRRKEYALTADGATPVYPVNHYSDNPEIGLAVDILAGAAATYTVEHTLDNVQDPAFDAATAKWYSHPTMAGLTADSDGRYFAPVQGIRCRATGVSGAGLRFMIQPGGGA